MIGVKLTTSDRALGMNIASSGPAVAIMLGRVGQMPYTVQTTAGMPSMTAMARMVTTRPRAWVRFKYSLIFIV